MRATAAPLTSGATVGGHVEALQYLSDLNERLRVQDVPKGNVAPAGAPLGGQLRFELSEGHHRVLRGDTRHRRTLTI
jgi:hypothetical protein